MNINNLISKRKAASLTKPYYIIKVTDIKPGAFEKWNNLLKEKYPDCNIVSDEDTKQYILNNNRIVKRVSVINNIKNECHMSFGWYNDVHVEYSDLEYEIYKIIPNVTIEKI
jgi:hypothetical protein